MRPHESPGRVSGHCTLGFLVAPSLLIGSLLSFDCGAQDAASSRTVATASREIDAPRAEDVAAIAEAYHLVKTLGDQIWPGWSRIQIPIVFVTDRFEYAIRFPKDLASSDSVNLGVLGAARRRPRTFDRTSAAARDVEGVSAAVIGAPAALQWSAPQWVLKAAHEMFHVLQEHHGWTAKVAELQIGPGDDARWQLSFPFPYKDDTVMRVMHLQAYPLYLAADPSRPPEDAVYNAGVAREAVDVLRTILRQSTGDDRASKYAMFQEATEGTAKYTEYRLAELASNPAYRPSDGFEKLAGAEPYQRLWKETYQKQLFLVKHAGRLARSRTEFYHVGLGKCLALDRIDPGWKARYFERGVWLDDLLASALGDGPR